MKYFAILYPGETLEECWRVCRECETGFEKYNFLTGVWEYNVELFQIYTGDIEVEEITEAQLHEIIARIQRGLESASAGSRRP